MSDKEAQAVILVAAAMSEPNKELEEYIEAVRRAGYAEGFAAAMAQVRAHAQRAVQPNRTTMPTDFVSAPAAPVVGGTAPPKSSQHRPVYKDEQYTPKPPRGTNRKYVREYLRQIFPNSAGPTELQFMMKQKYGLIVPYSSIRHAIDQLERTLEAEEVEDTKTWRATAPAKQGDDDLIG